MALVQFFALALILVHSKASLALNPDLIIRGVRVWTHGQAEFSLPIEVHVQGNRISYLGPISKKPAKKIIQAYGKYLIPGLIDCHTHLMSVPGSQFRNDSKQQTVDQQKAQLESLVAAGVTTVLDAGMAASAAPRFMGYYSQGIGPRIRFLAPYVTPVGGYFADPELRGQIYSDIWKPYRNLDDLKNLFKEAKSLNPFGAKLALDEGLDPLSSLNLYTKEEQKEISRLSSKYQIPLLAHSMTNTNHRTALKMGVYGLMHLGFIDEKPDATILKELKDSNVYVVTTLAVFTMMGLQFEKRLIEASFLNRVTPRIQLETFEKPSARAYALNGMLELGGMPGFAPEFLFTAVREWFFDQNIFKDILESQKKSVYDAYKLGVKLVLGADMGNWPRLISLFHGAGTIFETQFLVEAGIPPHAVLSMGTKTAAEFLKYPDLGEVKNGFLADLVVYDKNPIKDILVLRNPKLVIRDGVPVNTNQ